MEIREAAAQYADRVSAQTRLWARGATFVGIAEAFGTSTAAAKSWVRNERVRVRESVR